MNHGNPTISQPLHSGFPGGSESKETACNAGDLGLIPGLGRSSGEENGSPLQYSCLKNPIDRGTWWATVHGVAKSWDTTDQLTLSLSHSPCSLEQHNCFLALPTTQPTSWVYTQPPRPPTSPSLGALSAAPPVNTNSIECSHLSFQYPLGLDHGPQLQVRVVGGLGSCCHLSPPLSQGDRSSQGGVRMG